MQIFKSLKQTLNGLLSFIKITRNSFILFLLLFSTSAQSLTHEEHKFVRDIKYCLKQIEKDPNKDYIDINPYIIVAMAILESDYGRSRFAKLGKNFFGIRTFDLSVPHMKPRHRINPNFGVIKFKYFCGSVSYTLHTLTTHPSYEDFRRTKNIDYLRPWAEDPMYIDKLEERIIMLLENNH